MKSIVKKILQISIIFLIWRAGLFLISYFADSVLLYAPSFPYADGILDTYNLPRWVYSWANFDGVHYLTIIKNGYHGAAYIQAFFPLYPLLSVLFQLFINNTLLATLFVSNISFVLFLIIWYLFLQQNYSSKIAQYGVLSLLLFPTSFFFASSYTESLFLLFVIGSFWSVQQKRYWLAAGCIALASATRITGILLLPAVLFEIVFTDTKWSLSLKILQKTIEKQLHKWRRHIKPIGIVSLGAVGLLSYMYYLYREFGDPVYFFHVQSEFGGGVRQETLVSYPQVIFRYIKILLTARPFDFKYFSYVQEFVVGIIGLLTILYSANKARLSYIIFSVLAFLLPTLTGTFSSMPRYILVCFPIFILLATWAEKSKIFRYTWFIGSSILLILNTILFIQGYWVA